VTDDRPTIDDLLSERAGLSRHLEDSQAEVARLREACEGWESLSHAAEEREDERARLTTERNEARTALRAMAARCWMLRQVARESDDDVRRLTRWKSEATTVIAQWETVYDALGRPGVLGDSKAEAASRHAMALTDEVFRLRIALTDIARSTFGMPVALRKIANDALSVHYAEHLNGTDAARIARETT